MKRAHDRNPLRRTEVRASLFCVLLFVAACGGDPSFKGGANSAAPDPLLAGPYPVGVTTITFVDPARDRPLRTEIWYPAGESARGLPPSPITDFVDASLAPLLADSTVPLVAGGGGPHPPHAHAPPAGFFSR